MLVALVVSALSTPAGLGISPDSTQYFSTASHLLRGDGFVVHWWSEGIVPQTHFPPVLPVLIATGSALGLAPVYVARAINTVALAVTILLTLRLTRLATENSYASAAAAALAVALSRDVQEVHAMAWSEPLYIALALAALTCAAHAITKGSDWWGALSGLVTGTAMLTRYAAGGLAICVVLAPLMLTMDRWLVRVRRSVLIAASALAVLTPWLARNVLVGGSATNRTLAYHPVGWEQLHLATSTVFHWLVPRHLDTTSAVIAFTVAVPTLYILSPQRRSVGMCADAFERRNAIVVRRLLFLYALATLTFLLVSMTFIDAQTGMEPRILAPLLPAAVVLATTEIWRAWHQPMRQRAARALTAVAAAALLASLAEWIGDTREAGLGYEAHAWKVSPLLRAVEGLPSEVAVYSNYPDAISFLTGREAIGLPRLGDPTSLARNPRWASEMQAVCGRAGGRPTMVAWFSRDDVEWFVPPLALVRRTWRSVPVLTTSDGVLDRVPPRCSAS